MSVKTMVNKKNLWPYKQTREDGRVYRGLQCRDTVCILCIFFVFTRKNIEKLVKTDYETSFDRYTHLFSLRICAKSLLPSTSQSLKTSDLKNLWVSYPFQIIILRSPYNLLWVTKQNEQKLSNYQFLACFDG